MWPALLICVCVMLVILGINIHVIVYHSSIPSILRRTASSLRRARSLYCIRTCYCCASTLSSLALQSISCGVMPNWSCCSRVSSRSSLALRSHAQPVIVVFSRQFSLHPGLASLFLRSDPFHHVLLGTDIHVLAPAPPSPPWPWEQYDLAEEWSPGSASVLVSCKNAMSTFKLSSALQADSSPPFLPLLMFHVATENVGLVLLEGCH